MKIISLKNSREPRAVEIKALLGDTEFAQLASNLKNLCVFATLNIKEPAKAIKTGARHSYAKYLLFPVSLRRKFKTDTFNFDELECGAVHYKDKLYVIYGVPRKGLGGPTQEREEKPETSG